MTTLNTIIEFSARSNLATTGDFVIPVILGLTFILLLAILFLKKRYKLFTCSLAIVMCLIAIPAFAEVQAEASSSVHATIEESNNSISIEDGYLKKLSESSVKLKGISIKCPIEDCEWTVEVSNGACFKGKSGQSTAFDLDVGNETVKYSVSNLDCDSAKSLIGIKDVVVSYTVDISDPEAEEKAIVDKVDARAAEMKAIFTKQRVSIEDQKYGAQAFGVESDKLVGDNTRAIYKAICDVSNSGGGTVVVPAGKTFFTSAIHLENNVNLEIEKGATLKFTKKTELYQGEFMKNVYKDQVDSLGLTFTRFESVELMNYSPFIYAYNKKNVAVTGDGTLDGSAAKDVWNNWYEKIKIQGKTATPQDAPRAKLFKQGQEDVDVDKRIYGETKDPIDSGSDKGFLRTNFIQPYKCEGVIISGVHITASPMWVVNPVLCDTVLVEKISINSHLLNNDGCDPECSTNVVIRENSFDVGDDCIAIKSGRNGDGLRINTPTSNIVIYNNTFRGERGSIAVGSEITGGVHNVYAHDNVMDSDQLRSAYKFKTNYIRGGRIKDIYYRNDTVKKVNNDQPVIFVDLNYDIKSEVNMMKSLRVGYSAQRPEFSNVNIDNFSVNKDHVPDSGGQYFFKLNGFAKSSIDESCKVDPDFPEFCYVEDFTISNSSFYGAKQAFNMGYVNGLKLVNCSLNGTNTDDSITDSKYLYFRDCDFTNSAIKENYLRNILYSNIVNCRF